MKICFFARVENLEVINRVQFYATDIKILKELGHEVIIATRFRDIPWGCDLYYVWWWSWGFQPLLKALVGLKPTVITGALAYREFQAPKNGPGNGTNRGTGKSNLVRSWWKWWFIRFSLLCANANVFLCRYEFEEIPKLFLTRNPKAIPLVVDVASYKPVSTPKEPYLLNVAWSEPENAQRKCLKQIVEAFAIISARFPNIRLVMAGKQGGFHAALVEKARGLGILDRIDFIGIISEEKKIELMQRCSVYLQPTLFEGFGLAIAEAMACGAPVLSSPFGAIPEVVGNAGVMADGEDPKAIADAVMGILANPELQNDLSRRARAKIVDNFSYELRKNALQKLISDLT